MKRFVRCVSIPNLEDDIPNSSPFAFQFFSLCPVVMLLGELIRKGSFGISRLSGDNIQMDLKDAF